MYICVRFTMAQIRVPPPSVSYLVKYDNEIVRCRIAFYDDFIIRQKQKMCFHMDLIY